VMNGRKVLMLGSNNYLGLTTHPKVREAHRRPSTNSDELHREPLINGL